MLKAMAWLAARIMRILRIAIISLPRIDFRPRSQRCRVCLGEGSRTLEERNLVCKDFDYLHRSKELS